MKLSKSTRLNDALATMGIATPLDAVLSLPRRYEDYTPTKETGLNHRARIVIVGVIATPPLLAPLRRVKLISFTFVSKAQHAHRVVAFNRPYLLKFLRLDATYTLIGSYDRDKGTINLANIRLGELGPDQYLKPIYSLPNSIEQHVFAGLIKRVYPAAAELITDVVPRNLREKYRLLSKQEAIYKIHFPRSAPDAYQGLRVLKYEEALLFALRTALIRAHNRLLIKEAKAAIVLTDINEFVKRLPYKLSHDQLEAVREIVGDMNKRELMYRLLQGDVGSGKTVTGAIALYANQLRGDQGALMVPTDALAKQHYRTLTSLFSGTGVQIALLVGSLPQRERTAVKEGLLDGVIDIVIGTHALFSDDVVYQSLGLAIIDEQHRFGVNQRATLASKGRHADLLLMSATPIPRTLALTVYGDMDVTTIKGFPRAKRQVHTQIAPSDDKGIMTAVSSAVKAGRQVFIIAPLIEGNGGGLRSVEDLFSIYERKFPSKAALLHGRMAPDDIDATLLSFVRGTIPIVVSTTVVEVGIDVPTAGVLVVYEASRFGLAALHQLRGRIGRDGQPATCILINDDPDPEVAARLEALVSSDDGFVIAEADLAQRGPGELAGQKQAGLPTFAFLNVVSDFKILQLARADAGLLVEHPSPEERALIDLASKSIDRSIYG